MKIGKGATAVVFEWPNLVTSRTLYSRGTMTGGCLSAFCFGASLYIKSARLSGVRAAHLRHCAGISWVIYVNRTSPTPPPDKPYLAACYPAPQDKTPSALQTLDRTPNYNSTLGLRRRKLQLYRAIRVSVRGGLGVSPSSSKSATAVV
jgi:hypothetical protein